MVEDGVAIMLSVIIIALVILIILYVSGVFGSKDKTLDEADCAKCSAEIDTEYDYTQGVRPFNGYSIKDTSSSNGEISSRASEWSDLWGKNLA